MATESELLRLALGVYEAALQPELWTELLRQLEELTSAGAALLLVGELSEHLWLCLGHHVPRHFGGARSETPHSWQRQDPAPSPPAVANPADQKPSSRTGTKPSADRGAGEVERTIARFLLPHLRHAAAIAEHRAFFTASQSVLDRLPFGAVFVARGGAAIQWNGAAAKILHAGDGFRWCGGILSAADPYAQARLRNLIDGALAPRKPPGPRAVSVPRPSLRRDYQVVAALPSDPFRKSATPHPPVALVLIIDPECQPPASTRLLAELYKLTRKEAGMVAKLSEGKSLKQAAQELSVTYETARTHLRRIFSKTGTSRQAELLLLVGRLSAADIG